MLKHDTKLNVHQRLLTAMQQVTYIQKTQKKGMPYSVSSHDVVTAKVRPALLAVGVHYYPCKPFEFTQDGNRSQLKITVRFVNVDDSTDYFDVVSIGNGIDTGDKGPGKALSYAVKYALLKALGLETGEDADDEIIDFDPRPQQELEGDKWAKNTKQKVSECKTLQELQDLRKNEDDNFTKYWKTNQAIVHSVGQHIEETTIKLNSQGE
tara:strand:- start:3336 stop:3962 length:627 start_codon:yes stop_codon:yes gene_type:complete